MQDLKKRSNRERTETTRQALIDAARRLFVEKGYAETSTPEIVAAAAITRGALYHHFADKQALFRAVVTQEMAAVAQAIEESSGPATTPAAALVEGTRAYLDAMAVPGRSRLLLLDAPAVLGAADVAAMDHSQGTRALHEGLAAAGADSPILATLLSAAFERAALLISQGSNRVDVEREMNALVARAIKKPD